MDSQYINLWTFCRENLFSCTNFSDYTKISWSILLIGGIFAYFILRKVQQENGYFNILCDAQS